MDLEALGPEDEDAELRDYVSVYIGEADDGGALIFLDGEPVVGLATAEARGKKGTGTCGASPRREINSGFQA
jgi:hypothetical protein